MCQSRCFSIFLLCVNQVRTLCRSDPTENDSVEGLRPNARGPGLVTFGVRVLVVLPCKRSIVTFFGIDLSLFLLHRWKAWCIDLYGTFFHVAFAARPGHGFLQE